jgi:hypothetical protein
VKHRLLAVIIFLSLVLPAFAPLRQDRDTIDLDIQAGYNGYFRKGQWTPVQVSVSNTGDNLTGEIRVRTGKLSGLAETTYLTPVDLPRNSRKLIFLYVSLEGYKQQIQVEVVDRSGRVVKQEGADIRAVDRGDVLSAVITDSSFGSVDLTARSPGSGQVLQANWQIENIPPVADALTGLDVMLFHDVDTGTLTADQLVAIKDWVLTGGHLIVTGGDPWQRTTAAFGNLLPVSLNGSETLNSLAPLADYLRQSADGLDEDITATRNIHDASARTMVSAEDIPLLVRESYGEGVVDFLAIDPNAEPLRSWSDQDQLWYTMLSTRGQRPSWTRGFNDWDTAREATLTTSSTTLPTFVQLCGFLVLYVLLIGPLNYLVLKRLNRREVAWITIPVLILGFSVLAYSVGFSLRGNVATINRLTVVRAWNDSDQAHVMSLIGVQSPRRSSYEIVANQGYMLRTLPDRGTGLNVPASIREETQYIAESIPIDAGMVASFVTNGYSQLPALDASAEWLLSGDRTPQLRGSVTNTTDMVFEDAVLLVKGESRYLGSLEPGETSRFDVGIGPQDPGPLTLGNQMSQFNLYPSQPWNFQANSPGWCFSAQGLWLTVPDIMRNETFSCEGGIVPGGEQETRRRYRLLASLIYDTEVSGGRDANVYLFAWGSKTPFEMSLPGKPMAYEDSTLYIFQLPVEVVGQSDVVEIPPAMTLWSAIELDDPNTLLDIAPTKFRVSNNGQAAFRFLPMPSMVLDTVEELVIKFQGQGPLRVEVWNWEEQTWNAMNLSPDTDSTSLPNPDPFIGPENSVNVRVLSDDSTLYNQVDYIEVAYRGRLVEQPES